MKKKKLISALFTGALACLASATLFTACGGKKENNANTPPVGTIETVYAQAQELGFDGTLEEFMAIVQGKDGIDGKDGVGIKDVYFNEKGEFIVELTNGTVKNLGTLSSSAGTAETPTYSEGLAYLISADGTYYSVVGFGVCSDRNIIIPSTHKGLPVKEIFDYAFESSEDDRCNFIESVVIPDSVTSIGKRAFQHCTNLTSIVIGNSVTNISEYAFYDCSSLINVVIPDSINDIGKFVFNNCTNLQYTIKDGLKYLGNPNNPYVYLVGAETTDITTANIPNTCKVIGIRAFENCDNLQNVIIPDSVASIGGAAFMNCDSLTIVVIPNSVTSVGDSLCSECHGPLTIYCEAEIQPDGWNSSWNSSDCPVVWGYTGE